MPRAFASKEPLSRGQLLDAPVHWPRPSVLEIGLGALKGIGPKSAEAAAKAGIQTVGDLVTRSESELTAKIGRGPNLVAKSPEYARKVRRTVANIEADEIEDRTALDDLGRIGWEPCAPS